VKKITVTTPIIMGYLGCSLLGAFFYLTTSFPWGLSGLWGMMWNFVLFGAFMTYEKNNALFEIFAGGMALLQLPMIFCWFLMYGIPFELLNGMTMNVGFVGVIAHVLNFLAGVAIFSHKVEDKKGKTITHGRLFGVLMGFMILAQVYMMFFWWNYGAIFVVIHLSMLIALCVRIFRAMSEATTRWDALARHKAPEDEVIGFHERK